MRIPDLDAHYRLLGDEDTGVGLTCRTCNRGGLPIAYLLTHDGDTTYADTDVVRVHTITALIRAGVRHIGRHPHDPHPA